MKVNLEDLKETEKKLDVYVPSDVVELKVSSIFNEFKRNANIKGFRKGKAPNHLVKSMYAKDINSEIVSELISESFKDALKKVDLMPVNKPDVTPGEIKKGEEFHYSAVFEIVPKFEVAKYEGLELKRSKVEVTDEEVEESLTNLMERNAQEKVVEDVRAAKDGDVVEIDFEGRVDGEVVSDTQQKNKRFILGKEHLIKEFEDNIIGLKKGEEAAFEVEYKEDFQYKETAGKTVSYVLKLVEIYDRIIPEAEEFVKMMGLKNLEELKSELRKNITAQRERVEQNKLKEQVVSICNKNVNMEVPESLIKGEEDRLKREFNANFRNVSSPPQIDEGGQAKFREIAVSNVKSSLIFAEIARKENLTASDQETRDKIQELAASLRMQVDRVAEIYKDADMLADLKASIVQDKVVELIKQKANIVEEANSKSDS